MNLAQATGIDGLNRFQFGDSPELADRLAALVVAGRKTATCSAAAHGTETAPGQHHVVLDGDKRPVAVIETATYDRVKFSDVTPSMAALEGEGDLSYRFWADVHRNYFMREGTFAENMELFFEVFRVAAVLDQEFARKAEAEAGTEMTKALAEGYDTPLMSRPDIAARVAGLHTDSFGAGALDETRRAALIVAGRKRGSTTAGLQGQPTRMGRRKVVLDGAKRPIAIIRTVNYEKLTFDMVTEAHAKLEGEGDLSLTGWRETQERFFRKHMIFKPDLSLWFDTFELEDVLDEPFARAAHAYVAAELADPAKRSASTFTAAETRQ